MWCKTPHEYTKSNFPSLNLRESASPIDKSDLKSNKDKRFHVWFTAFSVRSTPNKFAPDSANFWWSLTKPTPIYNTFFSLYLSNSVNGKIKLPSNLYREFDCLLYPFLLSSIRQRSSPQDDSFQNHVLFSYLYS